MMKAQNTKKLIKWFPWIYVAIAVLSILFMAWHAEDTGFWYDEYGQLSYSAFGKTPLETALILDPTPPLFSVLANLWCRVVPYGQGWLLLLPQLFMGLAVFFMGMWGECLQGKLSGVCAAILLGFSQMVIEQCGFEFRSYSVYLFFAVFSAYIQTLRLTRQDTPPLRWAHALALTGLLYSHLFGALLALAQLSVELVFSLRKKTPRKNLLIYVAAGLLFMPWALYFAISTVQDLVQARGEWMTAPSLWDVAKLIAYLCSNNIFYCILFAAGCVNAVFVFFRHRNDPVSQLRVASLLYIVLPVAIVFLFSIIRAGYASLWVKRYFTGLFPCAAMLAAFGVETIAAFFRKKSRFKAVSIGVSFLLLLPIIPVSMYKTAVEDTPLTLYSHREAAELLLEQSDIHEEDTIVLSTLGDFTNAWMLYTVEQDGRRGGFTAESLYDIRQIPLEQYQVVYVDDGFPGFPEEREQALALLTREFKETNEWASEHIIRYSK